VVRCLGRLENWPKVSSRASLEHPGASPRRRQGDALRDGGCWNWAMTAAETGRRRLLQLGSGGGWNRALMAARGGIGSWNWKAAA
jgi:hypothetical protein